MHHFPMRIKKTIHPVIETYTISYYPKVTMILAYVTLRSNFLGGQAATFHGIRVGHGEKGEAK